MTLADWQKAHPNAIVEPKSGYVIVTLPDHGDSADLWHLRDYVVSSTISGPGVILVPRRS